MILNDADEHCAAPHRRRRSHVRRVVQPLNLRALIVLVLVLAFAGTGCADGAVSSSASLAADPVASTEQDPELANSPAEPAGGETAESEVTESAPTSVDSPSALAPTPTATPHPLTATATELPRAPIGFEALFQDQASVRRPVSLVIEDIDVADALVVPVGVNPEDSSLEVPPADEVGWYEFGSAPGEPGSAVLAAHIAYDGEDGVFLELEQVEIGAIVLVGLDDGTTLRYRIDELQQYDKDELPDSLWERDGDQRLVLITCGGAFNPQLRSYESNTVAIATPLGD